MKKTRVGTLKSISLPQKNTLVLKKGREERILLLSKKKIFNNIKYYILHLHVVAAIRRRFYHQNQGIPARAPCLMFRVLVPSSFARGMMLDSASECLHVGLQNTPEHVSTNLTFESLNTHHAKAVW